MKGLNIKRIAAIGLGAALVGSVLAPAAFAGQYTNLDQLQKSDVISATGQPVVDIVVGTIGQPADVIWAGNIAAKVAQMAVVPVGSAANKTVDFTVGGTTSTEGQGNTVDANILQAYPSGTVAEFTPIQTTSSDMPALINDSSWKITAAGSDETISVFEQLDSNVGVTYQDNAGSSNFAPGQLLGTVAKGAMQYTVNLGAGIPIVSGSGLDSNINYKLKIPLFGQTYTISEMSNSGTDLVMFSQTSPSTLNVGQSITVAKADTNKTYTIVLKDITKSSDNASYVATFDLMDGTTVVDEQSGITSGEDLRKDVFGTSAFDNSVYVDFVGASIVQGGSAYVTLRTGTSRLEVKNGQGFPYTGDSSADTKAAWRATVNTSGNVITSIVISNQWAYNRTSGSESDVVKNSLKVGDSITLPNDFAKLTFVGLTTKPLHEIQVGAVSDISGGGISYPDYKGSKIGVPFMVNNMNLDLNSISGSSTPQLVSVAGHDYTFWLADENTAAHNSGVLYYIKGDQTGATAPSGSWSHVDVDSGVPTAAVSLDLGAYGASGAQQLINYYFVTNLSGSKQALLLAGNQQFYVANKASTSAGQIKFFGTDTRDVGTVDANARYYIPDAKDESGLLTGFVLDDTDKHYMVAQVSMSEDASYVAPSDTNFYVQTGDTAQELNVDSLGSDLANYTRDAVNPIWVDSIRQGTDYLQTGATSYGSEVSADGSVYTIQMPEELRKAEMYLGSTATSTTTTGGASYTGVQVGQTQGGVTVNAIAGATTGVQVVPVTTNFVVSDSASVSGKSILVGGWLANQKVAADLVLPNNAKLNETLVQGGDYVDAVLTDGSILVAGWNASDTGTAAQALITALDALQ